MFILGGLGVGLLMSINLHLPTVVTGAVMATTLSTIGGVGAQLREMGIGLMAQGDFDRGMHLFDMGSQIMGAALYTCEVAADAIEIAGLGQAVFEVVRAVPSLIEVTARSLRTIMQGKFAPRLLRAINRSPQVVKALGATNLKVIEGNTYLQGLVSLEDFATANGWKIIGESRGELVHYGARKAATEVDKASKTIKIYLTAEKASSVRLVEFADEVSHAINAICGKPNSNGWSAHARYFADAVKSTLIPYTTAERTALQHAVEVLVMFADDFD
jgi:hypothetical protein